MTPLVAVALHLALQAGALALAWRFARAAGRWRRALLLAASAALLALSLALYDGGWLLGVLPLRDLALVGTQVPLAAGLLAGLALAAPRRARWRRVLVAVALVAVADWVVLAPLVKPPPAAGDEWSDGTCLQTTEATCAPAAAATLLRLHGIRGDEATLARWCLTTARGTTRWGLWRGLCALTDGTPWMVEAFDGPPETVLGHGPAIVSVVLTRELDARDPRYRTQWGWVLGQPHAVLYLGPGDGPGRVRMADPKVGVEEWEEEGLRALWRGQGFRLVVREAR